VGQKGKGVVAGAQCSSIGMLRPETGKKKNFFDEVLVFGDGIVFEILCHIS